MELHIRTGNPADTRAKSARAFVHVASGEIAYIRSGRGAPMLVIAASRRLRAQLRALFDPRYLVIAPEFDAPWIAARCAEWLTVFVDSLGITRPHLILCGSAARYVRGNVLEDPDRFGRIVLLGSAQARHGRSGMPVERRRLVAKRMPLRLRHTYRRNSITAEGYAQMLAYLETRGSLRRVGSHGPERPYQVCAAERAECIADRPSFE